MNKVNLIGRLTRDPELKFTTGTGTAMCTFTLAVNRRIKRDGQPEADFIPVVVWGKQAESTANYMNKGKQVAVAGRMEMRSYEAKDGTKRYVTEVIADEVDFIDWGSKKENTENRADDSLFSASDNLFNEKNFSQIDDDVIPF